MTAGANQNMALGPVVEGDHESHRRPVRAWIESSDGDDTRKCRTKRRRALMQVDHFEKRRPRHRQSKHDGGAYSNAIARDAKQEATTSNHKNKTRVQYPNKSKLLLSCQLERKTNIQAGVLVVRDLVHHINTAYGLEPRRGRYWMKYGMARFPTKPLQ